MRIPTAQHPEPRLLRRSRPAGAVLPCWTEALALCEGNWRHVDEVWPAAEERRPIDVLVARHDDGILPLRAPCVRAARVRSRRASRRRSGAHRGDRLRCSPGDPHTGSEHQAGRPLVPGKVPHPCPPDPAALERLDHAGEAGVVRRDGPTVEGEAPRHHASSAPCSTSAQCLFGARVRARRSASASVTGT